MTKPPSPRDGRVDDDGELISGAVRAFERSAGRRIRVEGLARLEGGSDRNVVARALVRAEGGTAAPVVIKAIRSTSHDAASPSVLRDSGLAREHVALAVLDARSTDPGSTPRLLAADAERGLIVLRDLGAAGSTLVDPLLGSDPEAGEGAVLGLAGALGALHAGTARCEADYRAAAARLYPASDGVPPSSLEGLRWTSHRVTEALGGAVDADVLGALAGRLDAPGPWAALTHGDPCPDNALRAPDGAVALLDFEFARPGHALFDATWWHMGFPSCWCAGTLPEELVARADARHRTALAEAIPEARDEGAYGRELAHLCAVQLLWSAPRALDDALAENGLWGTARHRERLEHWLSTVAGMLGRTGALPSLAPTVDAWLEAVRRRGGCGGSLSPYPPWRRATEADGPAAGDLAMAAVVRDGRVLVQRRHRRGAGFVHEFPGGAVEAGETWESAAVRELVEETGLREADAVARFVHRAEGGRRIGFVVLDSRSDAPPVRTDERRRQSFLWLVPESIPLDDFHAADRRFIVGELPSALRATSDRDRGGE